LLTSGNRDLRRDGIFTWSIPALNARLRDGSNFVTCPEAGVCARLCYARSGTYRFSNVLAAHTRNLEMVLDDLDEWSRAMLGELRHKRYRHANVRVHDSGDFFSEAYLDAWLAIAAATPDVLFYAYTKQVRWVKARRLPRNFVVIFSLGGNEDEWIDRAVDRHCDVFPSDEALRAAGYTDQGASDLLAATLPTNRIGIVTNNIAHIRRKQGDSSFGSLQTARSRRLARRE
jgi:hypothetical protein